mmetsp:Transcript_16904/g.36701  ORF Transcript_16904/g.36701 Transcript_16904/m.36701 type:complete len:221 (-) Transcript_16904:328-990(-)
MRTERGGRNGRRERRDVLLELDGVEVACLMGEEVPEVELRVGREEHVGEIVQLANECYRGKESWTTEAHLVRGQRVTPDRVREYMSEMDIIVALDVASKSVVGCVKTGTCSETVVGLLPAPAGYIGLVCVHPKYQSHGLGRALITIAEARCMSTKPRVNTVVMDVISVRKDLISWYQTLGYVLTDRSTPASRFMTAKGEQMLCEFDFVLLEKQLTMEQTN